jgi:hypothetical protein
MARLWRLELEHVSADEVEPGAASGAKVAERLGAERRIYLDAGDEAVGPTRSAINRITAPGPAPTSRQDMPG